MRKSRAFTLIELLIVVAIIAILAAIAVPNFLEAQVRAKSARTKNDLRTLATGLEMYRVDNNIYPYVTFVSQPLTERMFRLTSPVAYMTSLPADPFFKKLTTDPIAGVTPDYVYCSGNIYIASTSAYNTTNYKATIYSVSGRGPDGTIFFGAYCMAHPIAVSDGAAIRGAYDPTNGTVSEGDIIRLSPGTLGGL